jgi:pimeloyl-ACP methyl ester carboxylesterase
MQREITSDAPSPCVFPIWENGSRALLVLFSGLLAGNIPNVQYDFASYARRFGSNKLFIRDLDQAWHHYGLRELSEDIDGTARFLRTVIEERDIERTVFLGVSSGGYAALLFGTMLGVQEVHAISPRTYLDLDKRQLYESSTKRALMERLYKSGRAQDRYLDVKEVMASSPGRATKYHIYYSDRHEGDRTQAEHLRQCVGVELHPHERGDHWLVLELVAQESFTRQLKEALGEVA